MLASFLLSSLEQWQRLWQAVQRQSKFLLGKRRCTKLSPIESLLQYRFATLKPLKARADPGGCRNRSFVQSSGGNSDTELLRAQHMTCLRIGSPPNTATTQPAPIFRPSAQRWLLWNRG